MNALEPSSATLSGSLGSIATKGFWQPVAKMPESFSAADKARLAAAYRSLIADDLMPAYRELRRFVAEEYLPKTRTTDPRAYALYLQAVQLGRQRFTGGQHQAQRFQVARFRPGQVQHGVDHRGHRREDRRPAAFDHVEEPRRLALLVEEHARGADGEREQQVGAGRVAEEQLRHRHRDVVRAKTEDAFPVQVCGVGKRSMCLHDTFRPSCRAAAEQPDCRVVTMRRFKPRETTRSSRSCQTVRSGFQVPPACFTRFLVATSVNATRNETISSGANRGSQSDSATTNSTVLIRFFRAASYR